MNIPEQIGGPNDSLDERKRASADCAPAQCSTKSANKTVYALEWIGGLGTWGRSIRRFDSVIEAENMAEHLGAKTFRVVKITTSEQIL